MQISKKPFVVLWVLCVVGCLAVLPYVQHIGIIPSDVSIWSIALLGAIQGVLFFGLICWISYKILPKTDLRPFPSLSKQESLKPAILSGMLVGLAIFIFDKTIFGHSLFSTAASPIWMGALASIYGAINEEVSLRLFLFTVLYFFAGKCVKKTEGNRSVILWCVNIFVALLFGIGHLPAAFKLASPSVLEIFRILFLNGIAGVVFGWLYWSRGVWTAIISHFVADLVIHVFCNAF